MGYPTRKSLWAVFSMTMLLCLQCRSDGVTNGFLSFTSSMIVVNETSNQIPVTVSRTGGTAGLAVFQVQIKKATQQDFLSTSKSGFLLDGQTETTVNFDLIDDNDPEDDETYNVVLVVPVSGTVVPELGTPSSLTLTILKNDDANGVVGFSTDFQRVDELQTQDNAATFQLRRSGGLYGLIAVSWEVVNGTADFLNNSGMTSFISGQRTANLTVQVVPDNVPEAEERFIVQLMAVSGGGRLDTDNLSKLTATVIINPNDSPIRFSQQTYLVEEGAVATLTVTRGIDQFGQPAGSTAEVVTVQYRTVDGLAKSGVDYQGVSSAVMFQIGDTQKTIYIQTVNDSSPEDKEDFSVSLFNSSYGTVLSSPSMATIQITSNDDAFGIFYFQSSASVILDEDDVSNRTVHIAVVRTAGNTGSVDVSWEIKQDSNTQVASSDFSTASSTVQFISGQKIAFFDVQVAADSIPEEAEAFTLMLTGVTGGARLAKSSEGAVNLTIIIRDSDDSYGVVTLADLSQQDISKNPRQLDIKLLRSIRALQSVHINYTVTYLAKGNINPKSGSTAFVASPATAIFGDGKTEVTVHPVISPTAFLEVGGSFYIELTSATLPTTTLVPPKSPRIGNVSSVFIAITQTVGNGAVYFVDSQTMAREPDRGKSSNAVLLISRDGSSGKATVNWMILQPLAGSLLDLNTDVLSRAGTVTLEDGVFSANISIGIAPDNEPELAEQFLVRLVSIVEGLPQTIDSNGNVASVTILENDNPGGTFSFSDASKGPFYITESTFAFVILFVQRTGGDLVTRELLYSIDGGDGEFNDVRGKLIFGKGKQSDTITISPIDDDLPELNKTYTVHLTSSGPETAVLGSRTSVKLTILQNDDANGVVSFKGPAVVTVGETPHNSTYANTVHFTVARTGGLFGQIIVMWNVTAVSSSPPPSTQLTQVLGSVVFANGSNVTQISVASLADDTPEFDQQYQVNLLTITGGAKFMTPTSVSLTIAANDDPIGFAAPTSVIVTEGLPANFTVTRGGQRNGVATIMYETLEGTADSKDYISVHRGVLLFSNGVSSLSLTVSTLNDQIPETDESFTIQLTGVTGDSVLFGDVAVTVTISANDDANGVIQFSSNSLDQSVTEGSVSNFIVDRERGTFGQVEVTWQVVDADNGLFVPPGNDLQSTSGVLVFNDTVSQSSIEVSVITDGKPELAEKYVIELTAVTGGGPPGPGARLSSTQTQANLTVLKNDDANGVLSFDSGSLGTYLPEDVESTGVLPGSVNVTVVRDKGLFGSVEVSWDIIPSSFPNLASFSDLLFEINAGSGVAETIRQKRRSGSDTRAFSFNGSTTSKVIVPSHLQPSASIISSGFTLSAWVQLSSLVNGYIITKATPDAKTRFYTLALLPSSGTHTDIVFDYLPSGPSTSISSGFQTVSYGVTHSALIDGNWHHIAISVGEQSGQGQANFYFDGKMLSTKRLSDIRVADRAEQLIVGQLPDGSLQYLGLLQDVRVYHKQLTSSEVEAIGSSQVTADLRPVAGYLEFGDSISRESIVVDAVSDTIPEPDEQFTIVLSAATGDARLSADNLTVSLILLRSDNGNGLFGFTVPSLTATAPQEPDRVTLTVERKRGIFDSVDVHWDVRHRVSGADPLPLASGDFQNTSGVLTFTQGETSEDLILDVVSDSVPELAEDFVVTLVSADPSDGHVGSTPTSAASINPVRFQANVTIDMNDDPYGVLEFTVASPPTPADPFTPPATIAPHIYVNEEDGTLNLTVVRANGLESGISVEYRTVDGSAVGSGSNKDFIATAGLLSFADGERFQTVSISLVDDSIPELRKSFTLLLSNPSGNPVPPRLGIAKEITVTIQPSDDALGVVGFASDSVSVVVVETLGTVNLNVERRGGALGPITVHWEATQTGNMIMQDLTPSSGNVTFLTSQTTAQIAIAVTDDSIPELAEVFMVILVSVTGGGRISSSGDTVSVLTVQSSDEPHGLFVFAPGNRPLRVNEANDKVKLTVIRELGKMGNVTVFYETVTYSHSSNHATEGIDYSKTSGMLNFATGETQKSFEVTINDDGIPELDESIFVNLTSAVLISGSSTAINSPRVGSLSEGGQGEIIVNENDDAHGVMELSSLNVKVSEPNNGTFLEILRTAGKFGSVTVKWDATGGSATGGGVDFTPDSGLVVFTAQQMSAAIPIQILNDVAPEFDEQFSVRITDAGVARLGFPASSAITIQQNDDPNGVFAFSASSRLFNVEEPQTLAQTVTLTVERSGGLTGVITVRYEVTLNGVLAQDDIRPVKGDIFFLTNQNSRTFDISILPDDIPEGPEPYTVTLTSVYISGGGIPRIGSHNQAVITILANDAPHGQVSFNVTQYTVAEGPSTTTVLLSLYRSFGTVGELEIFYKTARVNITTEAAKQGLNIISFFSSPVRGFLSSSFNQFTSSLSTCSNSCLNDDACKSFSLNKISSRCFLHTQKRTDAGALFTTNGNIDFYEKDDLKVRPFVRMRAVSRMDYNPAINLITTIADGSRWGFINITINPDTVPELDETFHVVLTTVQLSSGSAMNPANDPTLGTNRTADVTIPFNDEAHGLFRIVSSTGQMNVTVSEQGNLAVPITVERSGGTLGSVSVDWYGISDSAMSGSDFTAPGATLKFPDGVSRASLLVSILGDNTPEIDETFEVALQNPTGGAAVLLRSDRVIVTISANDDIAGVIGFASFSRSAIVSEGQLFNMTVERQTSAVGVVTVFWRIDGDSPSSEFEETVGSLLFLPNQTSGVIKLRVKSDSMPETAEPFTLRLYNISTVGVSLTGSARILTAESTASVTIKASNEPHGKVEFDSSSLKVTTSEGNRQVSLTVVRLFGSIGTIRVNFTALAGSISSVQKDTLALATSGHDFTIKPDTVLMGEGVKSVVISVNILEDSYAELDEAFLVNLTSVELIGGSSNTIVPQLAANSLAEVIISSNDGTRGEFVFATDNITVAESDGLANIEILRKQGTFGDVTVFVFVLEDGATGRGTDFDFNPMTVSFNSGEANKTIEVKIVDDSLPEVAEKFLLRLTNPTGGATVSKPDETTVTITENDDPHGIISFLPSSMTVSTREPTSSTQPNSVQITVIRQGGVFGEVIVQWAILGDAEKDLQRTSGAIVFQEQESQQNIVVEVLADDVPELSESYDVILQNPTGGAVLASAGTTAVVIIDANDDPNGIIHLNFNETSASVFNVEENVGQIKVEVKRSAGTFGRVTCLLTTQDGTATSGRKQNDYFAVAQTITTIGAEQWYSFSSGVNLYILLASSNRTGDLPGFNTTDDGAGNQGGGDQGGGDDQMSGSGSNPSQSPGQGGQGPTPFPNQGGNGQQPGTDGGGDVEEPDSGIGSGLYRWNGGGIERIQGITTNGAYSWTTFTVGSTLLAAVANFGEDGARETMSRLYSFVNGRLQPSQDISTKGATDVIHFQSSAGTSYLMFANYEDDTGNRNIDSAVLQGSGVTFSHHQALATQGARALATFDILSTRYLAIANSYSTVDQSHVVNSQIFIWDGPRQMFTILQNIPTSDARDVHHFTIASVNYLAFCNGMDSAGDSLVKSPIYRWSTGTSRFTLHQEVETLAAQSIKEFKLNGSSYLAVSSAKGQSKLYWWNVTSDMFEEVLSYTSKESHDIHPLLVSSSGSTSAYLLFSEYSQSEVPSPLFLLVKTGSDSDYVARQSDIVFEEGVNIVNIEMAIINDTMPEVSENFSVKIANVKGGARLGSQDSIAVNILTNDDAHGLIGFAKSSLAKVLSESEKDTSVQLDLVREKGTFGEVEVAWATSGTGAEDVSPQMGTVTFAAGANKAVLIVNILADTEPELEEVVTITLTGVVQGGVAAGSDKSRGAKLILSQLASVITIEANDDPHGVVSWSPSSLSVKAPEVEGADSVVTLTVVREFGTVGVLFVNYTTVVATGLATDMQATPDMDYVSEEAVIKLGDNETSAVVKIVIKQDNIPEIGEYFFVNLTDVWLENFTNSGNNTIPPPSIMQPDSAAILIQENDNSRGILVFSVTKAADGTVRVTEDAKTVMLTVERKSGTFGTIGCSWSATPRSALGNGIDFSPPSGTLRWSQGDQFKQIPFTITNDNIPEVDEIFEINLYSPTGGARIGSDSSVVVTIEKNDDANGKILFDPNSQIVTVDESGNSTDPAGLATLTVRRDRGVFGTVNVQWAVEAAGRNDLSPSSGVVVFAPNISQQIIETRAVADDLPEDNEHYTVTLTSADGGATLDARRATIFIRLNGDANGVVSIGPHSLYLVLSEAGPQSTGSQTVNLVREAGSFGTVQVHWRITPDDGNFLEASGTAQFVPRQQNASVNLLVLADTKPELTKAYRFELEAISGGARLNSNPGSTISTLVVTASDNPHGIVQFTKSKTSVSEHVGKVALKIERLDGTFGIIRVNYSSNGSLPSPAVEGSDYSLTRSYVDIPNGGDSVFVDLLIIDDLEPELAEGFSVSLNSIALISDQLNTTVINGHTVDIPPAFGSAMNLLVTISANDDPHGVIEFNSASTLVDTLEDIGILTLTVIRNDGTFGVVSVVYEAINITAFGHGDDYSVGVAGHGTLQFLPGQKLSSLYLVISDDDEPELQETFQIRLTGTQGGARLGDDVTSLVTISANDDPSGVVGFDDGLLGGVLINNPSVSEGNQQVNLTVYRTAGDVGQIEVSWSVSGPELGREFHDILPSHGVTVIGDKERSGVVPLVVLADDQSELNETFLVRLISVAGGAILDSRKTNVTLMIPLHGEPFGVIDFYAEGLVIQEIREPTVAPITVTLPVQRTKGTVGDILVFWSVVNVSTSSDISPTAGNLSFSHGASQSIIQIDVLPDTLAELRETFTVELMSSTGGSKIGRNSHALFTVRANDLPHGVIGFSGQQAIRIVNEGSIHQSRQLVFGLQRKEGTIGNIRVDFSVTYSQMSSSPYVPATGSVVIEDGQSKLTHELNISATAFLVVRESFQITLTSVQLLTTGANDLPPELDRLSSSVSITISDISANSVVRFADMSLQAAVDDTVGALQNNVDLTVTRDGLFGDVDVYWQSGANDSSLRDGHISPNHGIVSFLHGEVSKAISVRADPSLPHGISEIFVIHLTASVTVAEGGAAIDQNRDKAVIEPHGVVSFASLSHSVRVTEGIDNQVTLTVWRRYGSQGTIEVEYSTQNQTTGLDQFNAHNWDDFIPVSSAVTLHSGQTNVSVDVSIVDNNTPEDNETFSVILLSAVTVPVTHSLVPSPRLSSFSKSDVTIQDNDDPHGIFTFENSQAIVDEEDFSGSGTKVAVQIVRQSGLFGIVSVVVRTFGGGEVWTNYTDVNVRPSGRSTQVNVDYQRLNEEIVFEEGVSEWTSTIVLYNDNVAELDESVYIELVNPTGGARLGRSSDGNDFNTVFTVLIRQNDEPNGLIGFQTLSVILNEDISDRSFADIILSRDRGDFGVARVDWVAAKQFGARTSLAIQNDFSSNTSGTVTFGAGQSTATIRLQLQNDETPENGYSFVLYLTNPTAGSNIYNDRKSISVTVEASDDAFGVFQFAANSRYPTISEDTHSVTLFVQRDFGTLGQATVQYATREAQSSDDLTVGVTQGVIAEEGVDYVYRDGSVEFDSGETQKTITIPLGHQSSSNNIKVFFVTLSMPSDGTRLGKFFESTVRITPPQDSLTLALLQLESESLTDVNEETILGIVMNLQTFVMSLNGKSSEDLNLFLRVLRLVSQKGSPYYSENDEIVRVMMSIFNHMLESSTFRGQSVIALTLHQFAFSLVAYDECPVSNPRIVKLEQSLLAVEAMRARPADINTRTFTSRNSDTVTLPNGLVKQNTGSSVRCWDIYFLDFRSDNWFQDGDPIFNSEDGGDPLILSVGLNISASELQNLENNVEYRINTKQRVSPKSGECLFWNYNSGRWSSDSCSKQATTSDQNYIVCQCNHLTDFAARGDTDDRTGWGPATQISCFVALAVVFVVWAVSHLASCCHQGGMLTAFKLLMHLLFAILVTEIVLVAAVFESRNASIDSCAALGGLIHYFGLAQFVWMMILSINLWQTLVANNEETDRYYLYYIITGWLIPLLTLGLYMLIGKYQLDWKIEEIYGDVHGNGDMCFIPSVYAALAAVVLPVLLCALVVGLVFTQAYQFPSRWKQYDDIYRNANNKEEVPKLLLLFTLIFLVWVMGGLHLAISTKATEVLFTVFNIVLACYIIIVYLFIQLRNMREKRSYYPAETLGNGAIAMDKLPPEMRMSHVSIGSHSSRKALIPDPGPWHDLPADTPPPPMVSELPPQSVSMPAGDPDSPEFDDLIFALRTGGTLGNDDDGDDDDDDDSEPLPDKSAASEHYEMRRISITDTRL